MTYILLILLVILVNLLPAFAPPTWAVLTFFLVQYNLNVYVVIACGVVGATLGRAILSYYIQWFAHQIFNEREIKNLTYLGSKFGHTHFTNFLFTFAYSLTPLSTTALFVAAGLAKIKTRYVLLGFFFGRLISYTVVLVFAEQLLEFNNIFSSAIAFLIIFLFIFTDWITLFEKKKFRIILKIWKWNKNIQTPSVDAPKSNIITQ